MIFKSLHFSQKDTEQSCFYEAKLNFWEVSLNQVNSICLGATVITMIYHAELG